MSVLKTAGQAGTCAAVAALLVTGCAVHESPSPSGDAPHSQTRAAVVEGRGGDQPSSDIWGTPVTLVSNNRVESACFDYTLVDIGVAWELRPDAAGCVADVRLPNGDAASTIMVRTQAGDSSLEAARQALAGVGLTVIEEEVLTVDGLDAYTISMVDPLGLEMTYAVVLLPEGRFTSEGESLTGVFIGGYTYTEELAAMLDAVVESIDVH